MKGGLCVSGVDDLGAPGGSSQGVAGFATDPAWQVTVLSGGRWSIAERAFEHAGRRWVIGLTPVGSLAAMMVWCDDEVIAHDRGTEAAMCTAARGWASEILADTPIAGTGPKSSG